MSAFTVARCVVAIIALCAIWGVVAFSAVAFALTRPLWAWMADRL